MSVEEWVLLSPNDNVNDHFHNRVLTFSINRRVLSDDTMYPIFEKLFSVGMIVLGVQEDYATNSIRYVVCHKYFPEMPEASIIPEYKIKVKVNADYDFGHDKYKGGFSNVDSIVFEPVHTSGQPIIITHKDVV